jgi:hypothetical protein
MPQTTEQAWRIARMLHHLPDTEELRRVFYEGARHTFHVYLDSRPNIEDEARAMLALNEELRTFVRPNPTTQDAL